MKMKIPMIFIGFSGWLSGKNKTKQNKTNKHNYLPMQEKQVWSLGGEDTLEDVMATHSSILA